MYSWSSSRSLSTSFGWLLIRCSRTRRRSRTMTILRKKASIGTTFPCVPALPGRRTSWPPCQRSAITPDVDWSAFRIARTPCMIFLTSASSSIRDPPRRVPNHAATGTATRRARRRARRRRSAGLSSAPATRVLALDEIGQKARGGGAPMEDDVSDAGDERRELLERRRARWHGELDEAEARRREDRPHDPCRRHVEGRRPDVELRLREVLRHRRLDHARHDERDVDRRAAELDAQRLGHADERELRRAVAADRRHAAATPERGA